MARVRDWSLRKHPRIITKFFGAEGAFVGDYDSAYLPVMGHVWMLRARAGAEGPNIDIKGGVAAEELTKRELLDAFVGLFNSAVFARLLSLYAPHVAGGQFDLSVRFVAPVPIPDLQLLSFDSARGRTVRVLGALGRNVDVSRAEWRRNAVEAAAELYGGIDLDAL